MVVEGGGDAAMSPDLPVSYRLRGSIIPACRDPSSSFFFFSFLFLLLLRLLSIALLLAGLISDIPV